MRLTPTQVKVLGEIERTNDPWYGVRLIRANQRGVKEFGRRKTLGFLLGQGLIEWTEHWAAARLTEKGEAALSDARTKLRERNEQGLDERVQAQLSAERWKAMPEICYGLFGYVSIVPRVERVLEGLVEKGVAITSYSFELECQMWRLLSEEEARSSR